MPFLAACPPGPFPHPTIAAIIAVESGGNPWAVHVNGLRQAQPHPVDAAKATAEALRWIAAGYTVDLGLMQVNSANLSRLGVSVADMFDTCRNIAAGSYILLQDYEGALRDGKTGQDAAAAALSAYNTGNFRAGIENGYVTHYDFSGGIEALAAVPAGSGAFHYTFNVNFADWDALLASYQAAKITALQHIMLRPSDFIDHARMQAKLANIPLRHSKHGLRLTVLPARGRAASRPKAPEFAGNIPLRQRDFQPSS
jgi:type IV secretion system protein VirB1